MEKNGLKKRLIKASLISGTILSALVAGLTLWKMNKKEQIKEAPQKAPEVRHFIDNPDIIVYSHSQHQKD